MKFDASHIRIEDLQQVDCNNGKPWADELTYGIIEAKDWDDAVELILDQMFDYDYGRTDMRVERGGKIILIDEETAERRIIECGC